MDGGGRLAQSLTAMRGRMPHRAGARRIGAPQRAWRALCDLRLPRGAGSAAALLFLLASAGYGIVQGGQLTRIGDELHNLGDAAANALGFRIVSIALSGQHQLSREQILAAAGITAHSSLLFLDAAAARARLLRNPWIAEATVLKLYPNQMHIAVVERTPFALWQKDGKVAVIADDGTVLESSVTPRFAALPLVVGRGAERRAKDFLTLLDRYPSLRGQVYASVLVAERRWNLKLKNGIDVRLPEFEMQRAFETLVRLDRDQKLLSRDIVAIDLRLPDRVIVRLSDAAAQAREDALKDSKARRRGGNA